MEREPTDLVTQLTREHQDLRLLATAVADAVATPSGGRRLIDRLAIELSRHLVAEDCYLLPAITETLADGATLVRLRQRDRDTLEQRLADLDRPAPDGGPAPLAALLADLGEHIRNDEAGVLPLLRVDGHPQMLDRRGYLAGADRTEFYRLIRGGPANRFLCRDRLAPGGTLVERVWRTMASQRRLGVEPGRPRVSPR